MHGATPELISSRTRSAGAALRASIRYLLLKPISSPPPLPMMGHWSAASPMPVFVVMDSKPSSNTQRRGLFSLSLMMRETRSMEVISTRRSPSTCTVLVWGMALR